MNGPDLADLQALAAVARLRHFRKAAIELRMSVSSLSQRLRDLEERLGVRLLNRTTRSVSPTEAGAELLAKVTPALGEITEALRETTAKQGRPSGRLRINVPAPAAELTMAPMLAAFLARYPDTELEIMGDAALIDIVAGGFDAGVRYEESLALDMIAVPLGGPERYLCVASPACLAQHGVPQEPGDLLSRPLIATRFASGVALPWEFEREGRVVRIAPRAVLTTNMPHVQVRAAIDGAGFLITFEGYVQEAVKAGALVPVLEDWLPPFSGPFLYYPSRRQPPPALAAFLGFLRDWRRQT